MGAIFWSLFGQIDRENFKIEEEEYAAIWTTGTILFGAFNVVAVLVALNMLIAMLNESYARIAVSVTYDFHTFRPRKHCSSAWRPSWSYIIFKVT